MVIKAEQRTTRQAPRKVLIVANSIKKLPLEQALKQLSVIRRRSSILVAKVMRQALANAWHNHGLSAADVRLKDILVTEGPRYKRYQAVSRGRAHNILKRTCHVKVLLESIDGQKAMTAKPVVAAPVVATKATAKTKKSISTKSASPIVPEVAQAARGPLKQVQPRATKAHTVSGRIDKTRKKV